MRLLLALGALLLGTGPAVTVLPPPAFPGPSTWTPYAPHHLSLVSSVSGSADNRETTLGTPFQGLPFRVVDRLLLPTAAERITWQGSLIRMQTYDHVVLVRLRGM